MAALAAAELGEGAEGAEAEGFEGDSEENASSGGVDVEKIIAGAISVAGAVTGLYSAIKKGEEDTDDIKERRYNAGLLTKNEIRGKLLKAGKIPAYYASRNIRNLISEGKMPFGWNPIVASNQGFGAEVRAFLLRQRRTNLAIRRDNDLKRKLSTYKITVAANKSDRDAGTAIVVNRIKQSVVG